MKRFRATLHRNTRENIGEGTKVLITSIETVNGEEVRDHMWVDYKSVVKALPHNNRYKRTIEFIAKEYEYFSRTGGGIGLKNISEVEVIKKPPNYPRKDELWGSF